MTIQIPFVLCGTNPSALVSTVGEGWMTDIARPVLATSSLLSISRHT